MGLEYSMKYADRKEGGLGKKNRVKLWVSVKFRVWVILGLG